MSMPRYMALWHLLPCVTIQRTARCTHCHWLWWGWRPYIWCHKNPGCPASRHVATHRYCSRHPLTPRTCLNPGLPGLQARCPLLDVAGLLLIAPLLAHTPSMHPPAPTPGLPCLQACGQLVLHRRGSALADSLLACQVIGVGAGWGSGKRAMGTAYILLLGL